MSQIYMNNISVNKHDRQKSPRQSHLGLESEQAFNGF